MNKLETLKYAFEKSEADQAPATKVRRKAKQVLEIREKLESEKKEIENISSVLTGVMCESKKDGLRETQEKSIEKLDADTEK